MDCGWKSVFLFLRTVCTANEHMKGLRARFRGALSHLGSLAFICMSVRTQLQMPPRCWLSSPHAPASLPVTKQGRPSLLASFLLLRQRPIQARSS